MNARIAKKISKNKGTADKPGLKYTRQQIKKAEVVLGRIKRNADKKAK